MNRLQLIQNNCSNKSAVCKKARLLFLQQSFIITSHLGRWQNFFHYRSNSQQQTILIE